MWRVGIGLWLFLFYRLFGQVCFGLRRTRILPEALGRQLPDELFSLDHLRLAGLAPDAYQTVRAIVRRPEGMPAGEYRSHIRVRLVNDDVDATPPADNQKIIVKANLVMIVPLIVRQGETSFAASLSSPKIIPAPGGGRMLELYIERTGNRSAEGDLKVFQSQSGILKEIAAINGLPVYHETARRLVRIQLPASAENGQLTIRYQRQSGEAIEVLAEAKL